KYLNKIKKVLATAMVGTLAFSVVGCNMIEKTPEAIQKTVLAKVGSQKVTKADLDNLTKSVFAQYAQQYGPDFETNSKYAEDVKGIKKQGIEILVDEKILLEKAKELNLVPAQDELDKQVADMLAPQIEQVGGEDAYKNALQQMGTTEEEYKKDMEKIIIKQAVIDDITKDVAEVSDEDAQKNYDENPNNFTGADISHILLTDEAKAKEVRERAANGEDFAALAKEFSEDTGSKENGGSIGYTMYNTTQLVPEFVAGMSTLKEGEISEPVKSQFGFHIIKATGVKVKTFEESKEEIKATLSKTEKSKIYDENLAKWKTEIKVKIYEDRL
ncbi:MAG: peptidylprolyl isomerase, partial [Clostridium sp.]